MAYSLTHWMIIPFMALDSMDITLITDTKSLLHCTQPVTAHSVICVYL